MTNDRDALPDAVATYLKDDRAALAHFTDDAVVTDEGHSYRGPTEIAQWMGTAASEFTYTTEFVSAALDGADVDVVQHLEGDFPGGVADLHAELCRTPPLLAAGRHRCRGCV